MRVPLDIQITFASGRQHMETWDGQATETALSYPAADPIAGVELDPEHKLHAEVNLRNNQLSTNVQLAPAVTVGGRLVFWAQMHRAILRAVRVAECSNKITTKNTKDTKILNTLCPLCSLW